MTPGAPPAAGAFAAVDIGASSGRVIVGRVGPGRLELTEVRRFRNGAVELPDGLHWDALGLYVDVLAGLRDAVHGHPDLAGLAIDTWGVDYGLIDVDGALVGNPRHYRDARHDAGVRSVRGRISAAELYGINGLQFQPFNTVYQLAADPHAADPDVTALLMPDLLGFWLTGRRVAEATNASTTGLLDAGTGTWSPALRTGLGLRPTLLPDLVAPGEELGPTTAAVTAETGRPLLVTAVGSHDTASAVVGVPAQAPHFGYISCGTWGLVGVELDRPVRTAAAREANFTNERGVDGTIRFLANVMGLWLLSESLRTWQRRRPELSLAELLDRAGRRPAGGPLLDPDDPVYVAPGDVPGRITGALAAAGHPGVDDPDRIVRCILDSLAAAFAARLDQAEELSGHRIEVVHMVGGGARNELLCQLTADACGRPVVAGPVEATALGNLLVQARTHRVLAGGLPELRARLRSAVPVRRYAPRPAAPSGRMGS